MNTTQSSNVSVAMPKKVEFNLPWGKIRGEFYGSANTGHPLIVALHGWLDNAASFRELAARLEGYSVLALDLAGHGLSDHRPAGVRYHLVDNVDDIMGVVDLVGAEKYVLLAHSMSAGFAPYLAAVDKRVEKLVLIEGIGSQSNGPDRAVATLKSAVTELKRSLRTNMPVYATHEAAVAARVNVVGRVSERAASILCERGLKEVESGFTWTSDPRLRTSSALRFPEDFVRAFLSEIDVPVLLLLGKDSAFKVEQYYAERVSAVKNICVERLEGNHHLHLELESVEPVVKLIREFLASETLGGEVEVAAFER